MSIYTCTTNTHINTRSFQKGSDLCPGKIQLLNWRVSEPNHLQSSLLGTAPTSPSDPAIVGSPSGKPPWEWIQIGHYLNIMSSLAQFSSICSLRNSQKCEKERSLIDQRTVVWPRRSESDMKYWQTYCQDSATKFPLPTGPMVWFAQHHEVNESKKMINITLTLLHTSIAICRREKN